MHLRYIAVENIVRKGEIACNKQFLLFSHCFLPYMALIFHFKCTLECRLQFVPFWTRLKFCHLVMSRKKLPSALCNSNARKSFLSTSSFNLSSRSLHLTVSCSTLVPFMSSCSIRSAWVCLVSSN